MKKFSFSVLLLCFVFLTAFSFAGCGGKQDNPPENPGNSLIFEHYIQFDTREHKNPANEDIGIAGLSTFDEYSRIQLSSKNKDVSIKHFYFDITASENTGAEVYITIRFEKPAEFDSETYSTFAGFTSNKIILNTQKERVNMYCVKENGSTSFSTSEGAEAGSFTIPANTIIQIEIGTTITNIVGSQLKTYNRAVGEYNTNISLTNFSIE